MSDRKPVPRPPSYDAATIEALAEAVYRRQLGPKDAAAMVEKDQDDGAKLRRRAQAYAPVVRDTLDALAAAVEKVAKDG
jgi:hypothetical protein